MRCRLTFYPRLRVEFGTAEEICEVIDRCPSYVGKRMNGEKEFTFKEKLKIAKYLGKTKEDIPDLFMKEAS